MKLGYIGLYMIFYAFFVRLRPASAAQLHGHSRHNLADTSGGSDHRARDTSSRKVETSLTSATRSPRRKADRPAETTTTGSGGTTSVQLAGILQSLPELSRKVTRCSAQANRRVTRGKVRPQCGWKTWVMTMLSGELRPGGGNGRPGTPAALVSPFASGVVDDEGKFDH